MGAFARRIATEHNNIRIRICRPDLKDVLDSDYVIARATSLSTWSRASYRMAI